MTELEPFFDSCDDFERGLLRSVRRDAPAASAASKTRAALGLEQAALAANAGDSVAAGASALGARSELVVWVLKGLAVGLLLGGVTMGGAEWIAQRTLEESRLATHARRGQAFAVPTAAASAMPYEQPRAEREVAPPSALPGTPKSLAAPPAAARTAVPAADASRMPMEPRIAPGSNSGALAAFAPLSSASGVSQPPSAVSIAEQVAMIERARSALKRASSSEALGLANAYVQRWPNGSLSIEAALVRIEAELALHDRQAAEREARAVISVLPGGRYAKRVRALFSPPLPE